MIYLGIAVVAFGVGLGAVLPGAAGATLIGASVPAGGGMVVVGLRGQKRGKATLARLRSGTDSGTVMP